MSTRKKNKKKSVNKKTKKIKVIYVKPKLSDEYMKSKEGEYFDSQHYDKIINYNCDCYQIRDGKKKTFIQIQKKGSA